ncbi:hypothetical protein Tco_1246459 [Tanacetum coccineum]
MLKNPEVLKASSGDGEDFNERNIDDFEDNIKFRGVVGIKTLYKVVWGKITAALIKVCLRLRRRLFKHIVSNSPELSDDHYILCDRVMYPLAPHYERKTQADHGTKRCRQSNSASSSSVFIYTSPSHHLDDNDDENEKDTSRASTSSPSQFVNSLSNVVPQVFENPPHENQTMHTYQTQILNHQS